MRQQGRPYRRWATYYFPAEYQIRESIDFCLFWHETFWQGFQLQLSSSFHKDVLKTHRLGIYVYICVIMVRFGFL